MKTGSKIFVAGHTGLVGSAILRRLRMEGYANILTVPHRTLDLTRQSAVDRFFAEERPEVVFLAAARVGGIWANMHFKAEFIYENMMIAANIIYAAHKYSVKKLLNLGSSCIYPRNAPQPMKEDQLLTGSLEPTNEPYAIAKISAIKLCRYYNEQYGTNFLSVMPTNMYGPNDNFDLNSAHALAALIRKCHLGRLAAQGDREGIEKDEACYGPIPDDFRASLGIAPPSKTMGMRPPQIVFWGTGAPRREFLHVDDLAEAVIYLMKNYDYTDIGEFINIGTGEDLPIQALSSLVMEIVGFDGECTWDASKPDGMPRKLLDVSRMTSLGWQAKISLRDGIRQTYDWYLSELAKPLLILTS